VDPRRKILDAALLASINSDFIALGRAAFTHRIGDRLSFVDDASERSFPQLSFHLEPVGPQQQSTKSLVIE
jgi:hypothetical protein